MPDKVAPPSYIHTDHEVVALDDKRLRKLKGNPNRSDVVAVAKSLARFGQREPLVVRRTHGNRGEIEAGNHRLDAVNLLRSHVHVLCHANGKRLAQAQLDARNQLGPEAFESLMADIATYGTDTWDRLAVLWVDDNPTVGAAYALASNRTARLGHDDQADLQALLKRVAREDVGLLEAASYREDDIVDPGPDPTPSPHDPHEPRLERPRPPRRDTTNEASATRSLVLPMSQALYHWATSHLAAIRRDLGLETDADALLALIEDRVGGRAPRDSPVLRAVTDEPSDDMESTPGAER